MFSNPSPPNPHPTFLLPVVGERYSNSDGSSRQDEIRRCRPGEAIWLEREPENRFDPSAVAVLSDRMIQIGYIGADRCGWIGSKISKGMNVEAIVERVDGDIEAWIPCRLVIRVALMGFRPAEPLGHPGPEILLTYGHTSGGIRGGIEQNRYQETDVFCCGRP